MKGLPIISSFFVASFLLTGCQTTSSQASSPAEQVVKYQSHCAISAQNKANNANNLPTVRVNPKYPISAVRKKVTGYTRMEFDISASGKVININVIESFPNQVFNKTSVYALSK